jgi:hypothetical protein
MIDLPDAAGIVERYLRTETTIETSLHDERSSLGRQSGVTLGRKMFHTAISQPSSTTNTSHSLPSAVVPQGLSCFA